MAAKKSQKKVIKKTVLKKEEKKEYKSDIPIGVKAISVLYLIGSMFGVLLGILFAIWPRYFIGFWPNVSTVGAAMFTGIIFILFSVIGYYVAKGLWHGQEWSRIATITLSGFGVIINLLSLFSGFHTIKSLCWITVYTVIGVYLAMNYEAKTAFR